MKIARTALAFVAAGALSLTACSGGTTTGDPRGVGSIDPRPSESPKPSRTKQPPRSTPPTTQVPTTRKPVVTAKKRYVNAAPGNVWQPAELQARQGDPLIVTNKDSSKPHSFKIEAEGVDSDAIAPGEQWTFEVNLEPGTYAFRCGLVPYMVAGSLTVFA